MENEENKDDETLDKYSLGPWIGLAIGVGVGAAMDNYIIGISNGIVLMLLINSRKPKKK